MALLFLGILISYMDRGNLAIAAPALMKEFDISPARMGILLSAFFWTYAAAQIPAGFVVDRWGIAYTYGVGLLVWSLASAAVGFATSFWQIAVLRLILGLGEAIAPVASIAYIKRNFGEDEQGLPTAIYIGGALVGPGIGAMIGGALVDPLGWRLLFIVIGLLGCLWVIPWLFVAPRQTAPLPASAEWPAVRVPWGGLLRSPVFWGVTLGAFFYSYYWYFIMSWVPTYLVTVRGFSNTKMGLILGLPLAGTAVTSLAAGAVADWTIRRTGKPPLFVRKCFVAFGFLLGSTIVGLTAVESGSLILPLFAVSMCGMGFGVSNYWALTHLISPERLIGRVLGYQNTIAQLAGVAAPILTGWLVGDQNRFAPAIIIAGLSPLVAAAVLLGWLRTRFLDRFRRSLLL